MSNEKSINIICLVIAAIIILPLFNYVGIFSSWYYILPKEVLMFLFMIVIPIGTFVIVKKMIFLFSWFITTWNGSRKNKCS